MEEIQYSVEAHVATITLNRPERKNAFTIPMVDKWAELLLQAEKDDDVRVVVVTGAGDAFCSGVDLDAFKGQERTPLQEKQLLTQHVHRVARALETLNKPVIAAVDGVAVGAGMDMALMCDLRIASREARFSEGYIRIGLVPGDGGCYFLPRIVGQQTALRLLWTGEFIDGEEAHRIGLVTEVVDGALLRKRTVDLATEIASRSPIAIQMIKSAVRTGSRMDLHGALDLISSHQAVVLSTEDSAEAYAAFRERRAPVFANR